MKLDMELAIEILKEIESSEIPILERNEEKAESKDTQLHRHSYHCLMLAQAGLIILWPQPQLQAYGMGFVEIDSAMIEDVDPGEERRFAAQPMMLTYEGHKFLETIRNEDARGKIRAFLTEHGLPFAFSTVKEIGLKALTG